MQALRITIPGDYWDVQIYRGRLYLWTMDGAVKTIDWDNLIETVAQTAMSSFAIRFGFSLGAFLYKQHMNELLADREFRNWALERFALQREQPIVVSEIDLENLTIDRQMVRMPRLPTDSLIYDRVLYAATDEGIWKATIGRGTVHSISTRTTQISDFHAVGLAARGHKIAAAASGDGLFQISVENRSDLEEARQVSARHCESADWVFQSIFGSSTLDGGFLVARCWVRESNAASARNSDWSLLDVGVFDEGDVSGTLVDPRLSWAYSEKIYSVSDHEITATKFTQKNVPIGIDAASVPLGKLELERKLDTPIAGHVGLFGTVVENLDGLVVIESDETQSHISGEITRWRKFPRARNYENHLHVILEDRLDIYGFYGDFFVEQDKKKFGIEFRDEAEESIYPWWAFR